MHFTAENLYHIYNRGNNRQRIFFNAGNYHYFLQKMRRYLLPACGLLAYTLMPNHFHFLIEADERTAAIIPNAGIPKSRLSEAIRLLLSSYTKGINKQQGFTGNLIQQKTKLKMVSDITSSGNALPYARACLHYIHQNALRAQLARNLDDWAYSSFPDFAGLRSGTLCNKERVFELFDFTQQRFVEESYAAIPEQYLKMIW